MNRQRQDTPPYRFRIMDRNRCCSENCYTAYDHSFRGLCYCFSGLENGVQRNPAETVRP